MTDRRPTLKVLLPSVPVPEDFEYQLWLRRALRQLPIAPVSETFEETLLQRLRAEQHVAAWRRGAFLSLLAVALVSGTLALWRFFHPPAPAAPLRPIEYVAPLVVTADQRFTLLPQPSHTYTTRSVRRLPSPTPVPGGTVPLPPPEE